jgi:hypothetical protein
MGPRLGRAFQEETILGYKLHLLITMGGLILDFVLAPANAIDLEVGFELLSEHANLDVLGDKGHISVEEAAELLEKNRVRLPTLPHSNQKKQIAPEIQHLFKAVRQMTETVNGQLSEQFQIEKNHAHTFWVLIAWRHTKLTAHVLCIFINRLLGKPEFLQIKALAFAN